MDTEHPQDREHELREPAERPHPRSGDLARRDNTNRVDRGGEEHHLATRPKPLPPATAEPQGNGEDLLLAGNKPTEEPRKYGTLVLAPEESLALSEAPSGDLVEIRSDGVVYIPWNEVANRLDRALGIGQWALVPEGKPMLQDGFVCWQWHLFVRGQWVSTAIGEHPDPKWNKMSLANRAESAKSDALVKCSKSLGIFRELWSPGWRAKWQEKYCERVWALQTERSTQGAWLWRRKDRRPFFKEKPAKDQMETEYHKRRDYLDDARDHMDSIGRED